MSLAVSIEWGLGDIKFLGPHSFRASFGGRQFSFHVEHVEHFNTMIDIPVFETDLLLLLITNKRGDNLILLSRKDMMEVMGTSIDFEWVAPFVKKKLRINVTKNEEQC